MKAGMKTELTCSRVIAAHETVLPLDVTQMSATRRVPTEAKKSFKMTFCALACAVGLSWQAAAGVPQIAGVNPVAANLGDTVTISGANFDANPANNIVHFGAVQAQVTSASATSLTVLVPPGATYAPVTVTVGGLTAYSRLPFIVKFNSVGLVTSDQFAAPVDLPADQGEMAAVAIADIDGDGKPDLIIANRASQSISVFRNLSTPGAITGASFAPRVDFPAAGAGDGPTAIATADLDGDGKLDVVVAEPSGGTIFVFRNTSTPGSITSASLAPAVAFGGLCGNRGIAIGDIDGDGKPDILAVCAQTVSVLLNTISAPGSINASSFAQRQSFPASNLGDFSSSIAIADIDGDGKPDVVVGSADSDPFQGTSFGVSLLRNASTVGNAAFEPPLDLDLSTTFGNGSSGTFITIGDLNSDGRPDIAVGLADEPISVLIQNNTAPGSFALAEFGIVPLYNNKMMFTPALADFDGDGRPDLAAVGAFLLGDKGLSFMQNLTPFGADLSTGPFSYSCCGPLAAESLALGDLDGDGMPDILAGYHAGGKISILRNAVAPCTAPVLFSASTTDGTTITACFNQQVTSASAQNPLQYIVNHGAVTVTSATLNSDGLSVVLTTSGNLGLPGTLFTVTASGIFPVHCTEPIPGGGTVSALVPPNTTFQRVMSFGLVDPSPITPSGLMQAADGMLYGTTVVGGSGGYGTIFRVNVDGTGFTVLTNFNGADGALPGGPANTHVGAPLLQASDGKLYGTTAAGGSTGNGTVFRINPDGTGLEVVKSFNGTDGSVPQAPLLQASDGALYGTTALGGIASYGTIFKLTLNGVFTVLTNLIRDQLFADYPWGGLMQGADGMLYGTTASGGSTGPGGGTIFKINTDGSGFSLICRLAVSAGTGAGPVTRPVQGPDGTLYVTTTCCGPLDPTGRYSLFGSVISVAPDGSNFKRLAVFDFPQGGPPTGPLLIGPDGDLYGTTVGGSAFFGLNGAMFKLHTDGTGFIVLTNFTGVQGKGPIGSLVLGGNGTLYGVATAGGDAYPIDFVPSNVVPFPPTQGYGTVFKLNLDGTGLTTVKSFNQDPRVGAYPPSPLLQGQDGAFYGTTRNGGVYNYGTVFKWDPNGGGQITVLKSFAGSDGANPNTSAGLVQGTDGTLYGTAQSGGSTDNGTVFKVNPDGTGFQVLKNFSGTDGSLPGAPLLFGTDGALYGVTQFGGGGDALEFPGGAGTVFKLGLDGAFTVLKSFNGTDGAQLQWGLIQGNDGALYGTTVGGGASQFTGTMFKISGGSFTFLRRFGVLQGDGVTPYGPLVQAPDGTLYGETADGGTGDGSGTIFRINPDGTGYQVIKGFCASCEGVGPLGGLLLASDGALYGNTKDGLFKLNRDGTGFVRLGIFTSSDGYNPPGGLVQARDGALYGTAMNGGDMNQGTIFRLIIGPIIQCPGNIVTHTDPGLCSAVVNFSVTGSEAGGNPVQVRCSPASGSAFPRGSTTVNCTATDPLGNQASCSFIVTVNDTQAPVVGAISAPVSPTPVNSSVAASANFTDNCGPHTGLWNWGDGSTSAGAVTEANGSGAVSGSHVYTAAGVYTLTLTVTDEAGNQGQQSFEFVVIYDPNAGFVTGGGWINSPAGAYAANPSLSGKATFGFVSKYQKGATVPTGQTQFQFQMASFNFQSTAYQWLVIAGPKAQYKGTGTVNGLSGYSFMLTATDGEINGGGGVDKFRIHITNTANGGTVYDNVPGAADDMNSANPEAISGGDIVIHSNR